MDWGMVGKYALLIGLAVLFVIVFRKQSGK